MLIITRRVGEEFVIADDIRVQVVRVRGTRVQLAVSAPESVSIHRGEVYHARREMDFPLPAESLAGMDSAT
jgi:carbon storage regulator CsrA